MADGDDGGASPNDVILDCEAGRKMGCASFCCRLLVRLEPGERAPTCKLPSDRFVPKREDGLCEHFDEDEGLCRVWHRRPSACREFNCNESSLLQVVLKNGWTSLSDLVTDQTHIPRETHRFVPYVDDDETS